MAKYSVTTNNINHPELDHLKFVSLDKGYEMAFLGSTTYDLYITASNHQGQAKYVACLHRLEFQSSYSLTDFSRE
ncbi:hypothetical protein LINGRAHAP2_LOCUS13915 [Linum grandiflorum]